MGYLLDELNSRNNDEISRKLFILAEEVCKEAVNHLKLIINQLPEFDIHDEIHSLKIIENIESLIGEESIKREGFLLIKPSTIGFYNLSLIKVLTIRE
ncbi:MAG: hypothetical protein KKD36_09495 [Bacteroidetes bacterium]|nr:hypothetical protein [Bacteroidota bacterium]